MATYTDNYQLTKPTYAEQADIGVINSNMNKIDDVMHSSQISLAPAYDQSQTYAEGDVVMYELLMYKCISPTTGVWDASKWERTTASESGGGGSAELDILGEASGAVASFSDGASAGLAKCIADINPVQDLHGYSKPWAGGSGKNLLPMELTTIKSINTTGTWTNNEYLINGVTYTVETDDGGNVTGITANGQASANADISIVSSYNPTSDVYFNGCPTGGGASTYQFYISGRRGDYGSGSYLNTGESGRPYLRIFSGYNASNVLFKPMIRLQTVADDTFEPYSNICPIEGYDDITINVSPTNDTSQGVDTTIQLGGTYYGGTLNVGKGELAVTYGYIASYNGETLTGEWLSDRDEYTIGGTPTTGAEVVYELATPITVQLTPTVINTLLGQNYISSDDTGNIDIVYVKASAPIQPNPTGTPTATLTKLGIEGTVFEVPSGGGESGGGINYSTTEQVIGTWIDGKPLYMRTFDLGSDIQVPYNTFINTTIDAIDKKAIIGAFGIYSTGETFYPLVANINNGIVRLQACRDNQVALVQYVTIKYTKITD